MFIFIFYESIIDSLCSFMHSLNALTVAGYAFQNVDESLPIGLE